MNPFEYVAQYHDFSVCDPRLGLRVATHLAGYSNVDSTDGAKEMAALLHGLSRKHFSGRQVPHVFSVRNEPRIDPGQHFSMGSPNRVFQSRGSPHEFNHALRLAFLAGRCGAKGMPNPEQYAKRWFTNDCVSFAGNYSGVSPSTPVLAYAEGRAERFLAAKKTRARGPQTMAARWQRRRLATLASRKNEPRTARRRHAHPRFAPAARPRSKRRALSDRRSVTAETPTSH